MKKVLISILTFILMISMITVVNAATGSISLAASSQQVVKGNTFTVTVAGTADQNITALQSALSYDTTKLLLQNKTAGSGFTDASASDSEIAILSTDNNSLSKSGTLYTLTFKVLDTAEEGETTISVNSATLALVNESQTQENVSVSDQSVTVTIKSDNTTVGNTDNNKNGETNKSTQKAPSTNSSSKRSSNSSTSSKSNTNTNTNTNSKTSLPQTGLEVGSIIAIAILSICAIISYVSYQKYKNI